MSRESRTFAESGEGPQEVEKLDHEPLSLSTDGCRKDTEINQLADQGVNLAIKLKPNYSNSHHWYSMALAQMERKTLDLDPNFTTAYYFLGRCFLMQGKLDEAAAEFRKGRAIAPNVPDLIALLGYTYATTGRRDQTRRCLAELDELAKRRYAPPVNYATLHIGLGETDLAFKWMEKGYEERDPWLRGLKTDPLFDVLRADPRFALLMRRAGFAQ